MLSARTLSNANNCLTSFLFNVVILRLTEMTFAGNTIYGRSGDTHGAGKRESILGHAAARAVCRNILPGAARGMPSISSSSWTCSKQSSHLVPLLNVYGRATTGFTSPPAPVRLCPASHRGGGCGKAGRGESLLPPLLWGRLFPKPVSSQCCAAFLVKPRLVVPLCRCPVTFKGKFALINDFDHSMKLGSTFSIIRGRTWAAMPTLSILFSMGGSPHWAHWNSSFLGLKCACIWYGHMNSLLLSPQGRPSPLLLCWLPRELEVLFGKGQRFAGAPRSLLAELGEDRLSQNERKGGIKSKFVEINHLSANGNRVSGVREY